MIAKLGLFLLLVCRIYGDVVTAPTFFECSDDEFVYSSGHCVTNCNGTYELDSPVDIAIYHASLIEEVLTGTCKRIHREVILTKTWTFSELPPKVTKTTMGVSKEACMFHWDRECNMHECSTHEPPMPNDYSWAADRTFSDEYYLIDVSRQATIMRIHGIPQISVPWGFVDMSDRFALAPDGKSAEIWSDSEFILPPCGLEQEQIVRCYETTQGRNIICPSLGLEFTFDNGFVHRGCEEQLFLEHGFLFSKKSLGTTVKNPHFVNNDFEVLVSVVESLKTKIKYSESLTCFSNCMKISSLEEGQVTVISNTILKKVGLNSFKRCHIEPLCKIHLPLVTCKGSELVQVHCGTHLRWWNGSAGSELTNDMCTPTHSNTTSFKIQTGRENIIINESGLYWEPSSLSPYQSISILDHHDTIKLSEVINRTKIVKGENHTAFSYGKGEKFSRELFSMSFEWFWKGLNTLKWILIATGVIIFLILFVVIKKRFQGNTYARVNTPADTPERRQVTFRHE
ncbi:TPA_asm: G [Chrysanthemum betacytorhabdovirus 1]|nr:TPA_asm: G [Chrysanthemum betacytorhabdovirus 1]